MTTFQPADHLRSRTFIGLLVAQFLAAFNDQAIHAAAMFYAFKTQTLNEAQAIALMPILFYAPWAIFCTVAGYLADKFSKRNALILWKVVEVGVTLFALFGFWLGQQGGMPQVGTWIVLSCVFLMGMHSAFFVPAKYGVMPEILTPRMLSRGNGALESLSFLAVILGTVAGGVFSYVFGGQEYMIGIILTGLAVVGALASFLIERMPAANPTRTFPEYIYKPLINNIRVLLTSRPLVFAVIGIAFFTFLVAYMRQVVYMHGQSQQPPWSEAYTSIIVGMVALGIGIGSPLAGYLSGGKVEVGLVPVGALGMVIATTVAAFTLFNVPVLLICIVFIGFFTGFYLVPLFSLIQHRAPKTSKGDAIATSNFINITGAIAASVVFFSLNMTSERSGYAPALQETAPPYTGKLAEAPEYRSGHPHLVIVGERRYPEIDEPDPNLIEEFRASFGGPKRSYKLLRIDTDVKVGEEVVVRTYELNNVTYYSVQPATEAPNPLFDKQKVPELLFLGTGAMTFLTLLLLWFFLPDLFRRTWLWLRALPNYQMELAGMLRLPGNGPALIVTDVASSEARSHLVRAADRVLVFATTPESVQQALSRGSVVAVPLLPAAGAEDAGMSEILAAADAPILPVHHADVNRHGRRYVYVVAGLLMPAGTPIETVREELRQVAEYVNRRITSGEPLEKEAAEH